MAVFQSPKDITDAARKAVRGESVQRTVGGCRGWPSVSQVEDSTVCDVQPHDSHVVYRLELLEMLPNVCTQRKVVLEWGRGLVRDSHIRGPCPGYISLVRFTGITGIRCGADCAGAASIRQTIGLCDC